MTQRIETPAEADVRDCPCCGAPDDEPPVCECRFVWRGGTDSEGYWQEGMVCLVNHQKPAPMPVQAEDEPEMPI